MSNQDPIELWGLPCQHTWEAGMMIVHPEDCATVARERGEAPECGMCGAVWAEDEAEEG